VQATVVVAAIIRRRPRLLISRRLSNTHLPGLWEFPGGKVQPSETQEQALRRELREELGIEAEVHDEVLATTHHYPEKTVELHFFECSIVSGEPSAIEVAEFRWVEPEELLDYEFPEADREIVARLMER
jgi:mutator protein MutT